MVKQIITILSCFKNALESSHGSWFSTAIYECEGTIPHSRGYATLYHVQRRKWEKSLLAEGVHTKILKILYLPGCHTLFSRTGLMDQGSVEILRRTMKLSPLLLDGGAFFVPSNRTSPQW